MEPESAVTPEPVEFRTSVALKLVPAMWIIAYGLGQLLVGVLFDLERGLVGLGLSLLIAVPVVLRGITRRHRVLLRFDAEGIHGPSGDLLTDWASVGIAWIGPTSGFGGLSERHSRWVGGSTLIIWSDSAIAFSRRSNFTPTSHVYVRLATAASTNEVASALRRFTTRPVYTPGTIDLKRLQRWMKDPEAVGDPA